jgi:catechol 2,3-dioxygenase-like lactoylglutathione lyase family enzyme
MTVAGMPHWAHEILVSPHTQLPLAEEQGRLVAPDGEVAATIVEGIVSFPLSRPDRSIDFYRDIGGSRFHERATIPYAMSTLDTEVYHSYLAETRPADLEAVIVDVGGGDGRNAVPWLDWGFRRVVVVDPVHAALSRLRARIATDNPDWLDRLLLIEADARQLPLLERCARHVQAIEALAYLNEEYGHGLAACVRLMAEDARLLVADRDYEGGLLTRLFYGGGVRGMVEQAETRDIWDGNERRTVRSRAFTAEEFAAMMRGHGLRILSQRGISALSLVLGHERVGGRLAPEDETYLARVRTLLKELGRFGSMRRSHVIIAERAP